MSATQGQFVWRPLPKEVAGHVVWDKLLAHTTGLFHMGGKKRDADCPPERLADLQARAERTLAGIGPELKEGVSRLRRERYLAVAFVLAVAIAAILWSYLHPGDEAAKIWTALIAAGGTGGLVLCVVRFSVGRADHEFQLEVMPLYFSAQFTLCRDCKQYDNVFEEFVRAVEALRGVPVHTNTATGG